MVLRFDVFIISPDRAMNMDLEIVKRDDREFAVSAEFIFVCDSMNIIKILPKQYLMQ